MPIMKVDIIMDSFLPMRLF